MTGNFGKLLDVDLTTKEIKDFVVPEEYRRDYLGGKGLGARLLWDFLPADGSADPLGPENPLLFLVGPLTGFPVMGSSRYVVMAKSPLSKFVLEAYGGGYFPASLKGTGYDGIIFRGQSETPVYLEMIDGNIELKDATEFWGKGVFNMHDHFVDKYGDRTRTAIIGQAGENLVRYAAVINDKSRAAARGGPGAVMGSKKLKAIIVKSNKKADYANEEKFREINKKFRDGLTKDMNMKDGFGVLGTSGGIPYLHKMGILPTKNFSKGQYEGHDKISGQFMQESGLLVDRDTCASCLTYCKRVIEGEYKSKKLTRDGSSLEYETLAAFGSLLLNSDIKMNALANQMCNDFGLDTISTGVSIAFAMEAAEKGLAGPLGIDIKWSDQDTIIDAVEKIALREAYGNELAEGTMRMAEKIGDDTFAMHTKGMEIAMHEPRGKLGLGLSYATSPRGGTHMEGLHDSMLSRENANPAFGAIEAMSVFDYKGKAPIVAKFEDATSFINSLIICAFDAASTGKFNNLGYLNDLTEAVTGYKIDMDEMLRIGERIYNMWRMVAVREGLTNKDDDLPYRFKYETLDYEEGPSVISTDKLDYMLNEYYKARKWDETGKPNQQLIEDLGLPPFD